MAERGSSKIILRELPIRWSKRGGQGGGGSLAHEGLKAVLLPPGRPPLVRAGSVIHTDSAKAYRNLGADMDCLVLVTRIQNKKPRSLQAFVPRFNFIWSSIYIFIRTEDISL